MQEEDWRKENSQTILGINPGVTEAGYVKPDEIVTYVLSLESNLNYNVTVYLHSHSGNPDLYVKNCKD